MLKRNNTLVMIATVQTDNRRTVKPLYGITNGQDKNLCRGLETPIIR